MKVIRRVWELLLSVSFFGIEIALVVCAWNHYPHDTRDTLIIALALCSFLTLLTYAIGQRRT